MAKFGKNITYSNFCTETPKIRYDPLKLSYKCKATTNFKSDSDFSSINMASNDRNLSVKDQGQFRPLYMLIFISSRMFRFQLEIRIINFKKNRYHLLFMP